MTFLSKRLGIDLGTANTLVFVPGKGVVLNEPSVVAISLEDNKILAVGDEAKTMIGRTPEAIVAYRPMKDGVIADYKVTEAMLAYYMRKAMGGWSFIKPEVLISVPAGVTSTERRAVIEAAIKETLGLDLRVTLVVTGLSASSGPTIDTPAQGMGYPGGDNEVIGENTIEDSDPIVKKALEMFGEVDITDRGGADDTPFVYALQRGHFCFFETDNYPDPVLPEEIMKAAGFGIYGAATFIKHDMAPMLMAFLNAEPFTTMFPEAGPNGHLFMRKIRKVFDPNSVASPGRQVFTEEEWQQFPGEIKAVVNKMRELQGMKAVE